MPSLVAGICQLVIPETLGYRSSHCREDRTSARGAGSDLAELSASVTRIRWVVNILHRLWWGFLDLDLALSSPIFPISTFATGYCPRGHVAGMLAQGNGASQSAPRRASRTTVAAV